jgi:hypothetical protein
LKHHQGHAQAFPLTWPKLTLKTKSRSSSRFGDKTVAGAIRTLKSELARMGAEYIVISTNIPIKANGDPYSDPGKMPEPGIAVYFHLAGKPYCLPCDRWLTVEENLHAVAKHVEAMRGMDRWGVGSIEQTFAGFKELPASNERDWTDVLDLDAEATVDMIQTRYRERSKFAHPDNTATGSNAAMQELNRARDLALGSWDGRRATP